MKKTLLWILVLMAVCAAMAGVFLVKRPANEVDPAGKIYVYEKEGIMGSFTLTLYRDGTFSYYEGFASSYLGEGTWEQDGEMITLTDAELAGTSLVNHFRMDGSDLVFVEDGSSNFIYVKVRDAERFFCTGDVVDTAESDDTLPETKEELDVLFAELAASGQRSNDILDRLKEEKSQQLLDYLMQTFLDGGLEGCTYDDGSVGTLQYVTWCGFLGMESLETVAVSPEHDWKEWSDHAAMLYERNGYDFLVEYDYPMAARFAKLLAERMQ